MMQTRSSTSLASLTTYVSSAVTRFGESVARRTPALSWISRAAWLVLAFAAVTAIAGYWLGWIEFVVLGLSLAAVLVVSVFFVIGRHPYEFSLKLREGRVVAGEHAMGGILVRNGGKKPALRARIELPVGPVTARFALPGLAAGEEHDELFTIPTARRGVLVVGPIRSVRGDPFGLIKRAVEWTEPQELYVHPRTVRLGSESAGMLHDLEGHPSSDITNADLSFHDLREYVPGDDRRYVHWRSTARVGKLMVRQFEESRRTHLVAALSTAERDYRHEDEFELAISAIGSLGLYTLESDAELSALTAKRTLITSGARPLLDDLTRLESERRGPALTALARRISADAPRATIAVMAFGSGVSPDDIRAAGALLPLGVRGLAIQCVAGAGARAHRLGAVTVLELGSLDDLPRGFRRLRQ